MHYVNDDCVAAVGESNGDGGVCDGVPLAEFVPDVFEWCLPVDHEVENAAKGPDITWSPHLQGSKVKQRWPLTLYTLMATIVAIWQI